MAVLKIRVRLFKRTNVCCGSWFWGLQSSQPGRQECELGLQMLVCLSRRWRTQATTFITTCASRDSSESVAPVAFNALPLHAQGWFVCFKGITIHQRVSFLAVLTKAPGTNEEEFFFSWWSWAEQNRGEFFTSGWTGSCYNFQRHARWTCFLHPGLPSEVSLVHQSATSQLGTNSSPHGLVGNIVLSSCHIE